MISVPKQGMEESVRLLLNQVISSLVELETILFFEQHPGVIENAEGVAQRLQREKREVATALEKLAASKLLERFELGAGRYVMYSYTEDPPLQQAIARLSDYFYDDPQLRVEIVKHIMGVFARKRPLAKPDGNG